MTIRRHGGGRFGRRAVALGLAVVVGSAGMTALASPAHAAAADSIDASPSGPQVLDGGSVSLGWTITAPDGSRCDLTDAVTSSVIDTQSCATGTVTFAVSQPGAVLLSVQDVDSSISPVQSAVVDVVPPAPGVTVTTQSPFNDPTPVWSLDLLSGAAATCTLTHGGSTVQSGSCTSPFTADDLTASSTGGDPGNYDLTVTQVVNGETSAPSAASTYDFETATPGVPSVTADAALGFDRHPTFTVTGLDGSATPTCTVVPSTGASVASCGATSELDLTGADDGTYTLHVAQTLAGNTSGDATADYVLDATAPATPTIVASSAFGKGASPTFTVSGIDSGAQVADCAVSGPSTASVGSCDTSMTLDLAGKTAGTYTVTVDAKDDAGNASPTASASYEYLPSPPPAPTVSGPAAPGNDRTPSFTVGDAEAVDLTYTCTVTGLPATVVTSCGTTTTIDLTGQADATYHLTVKATDRANQTSPAGTATYTLDATTPKPTVALLTPSSSPAADTAPSFTFSDAESVDGPDTYSCTWSAPDGTTISSGTCASGDQFDTAGHGNGDYTLAVQASDTLGNQATKTLAYTLEATAPPAPTVAVSGSSIGLAGSVDFTVTDAQLTSDLTYACTLSGGAIVNRSVTPCGAVTTVNLAGVADGDYTLSVTATDGLGHTSPAGTATYTVDSVAQAPTVTLSSPLTSPSTNASPTFTITDNELAGGPDSFRCTWTGPGITLAVAAGCASGDAFPATSDGTYTLSVTATDSVGNVSAPATATFGYDATAPAAPVITPMSPAGTVGSDPTPTFSVTNPGDNSPGGITYSCTATNTTTSTAVDPSDISCGPTTSLTLGPTGDGDYTLSIVASDATGNASAPSDVSYTLDSIAEAPTVTRATPAASPATATSATFTIADNELVGGPDTFSCTWTGPGLGTAAPTTCVSGASFPAATDGAYTLSVTATDSLGSTSAAATASYTRDTAAQAPTVTLLSPTTSPASSAAPVFSIADNELIDGPDAFDCTWSGPAILAPSALPCASGDSFPAALDGTYTLSVTATDQLGNTTSASADYVRDTAAQTPTVSLASPASSPGASTAPSFTIVDNEVVAGPDTFQCTWTGPGISSPAAAPCASGDSFPAAADGDYTLSVVASDQLGNSSSPATATYTFDGSPPATPTVTLTTPASSPANVTTPTFSVAVPGDTSPGGLTYACVMTNTSTNVTVAAGNLTCGATVTAALAATGDGVYSLAVTATDTAGNSSSAAGTAAYTLDTTAPGTPAVIRTAPVGSPGTSATPTFTASNVGDASPGGLTYTCAVTYQPTPASTPIDLPAADVDCGPTITLDLSGSGDADYTLLVTATDASGNSSGTAGRATYSLDDVVPDAPTVALTSPAQSPGNATSPTFSVTNPGDTSPGGLSYTCSVTMTSVVPNVAVPAQDVSCGATTTLALATLGDGDYTLSVTAADQAGNASLSAGTATYTLDTATPAAPTVTLTSPATSPGVATAVSFSVTNSGDSSPGGLTYTCTVSGPTSVPSVDVSCGGATTVDLSGVGRDGSYTLSVVATDAAGNVSLPGTATYALDTTAPSAPRVVLSHPGSSPGNVVTPTFAVSNPGDVSPGGLSYRCSVSEVSPVAAALDPTRVSCGATTSVDLSGPGHDGTYRLVVTATDLAGNVGATAGTATYVLDTAAPPPPSIVSPPPSTRQPTFGISDGDPTASLTCTFTSPTGLPVFGPASCPSGGTFDTTAFNDGGYTLTVVATDPAGNSASASVVWTRDTTPPPPPTVTAPASPSNDTTPTFTIADSESTAILSCVLTGPDGTTAGGFSGTCPADGTLTISGSDGVYVLVVTATDPAGNVQTITASATYTLDTAAPTAPVVSLTQPSSSPGNALVAQFAVTVVDSSPGPLTLRCQVTGPVALQPGATSCGATTTVNLGGGVPDGTYTLSVTAVDAAGNLSPAGSAGYQLDTTAPSAPTVTLSDPMTSPGAVVTPSFAVDAADAGPGSTLACKVVGVTPVPSTDVTCGPMTTVDLSGAGRDGEYTLEVTATDAAGNVGTQSGAATYLLDTTPPAAPVVQLATATRSSDPTPLWVWRTPDRSSAAGLSDGAGSVTATCVVSNSSGWSNTTPNCAHEFSPLLGGGDGRYQVTVTLTDAAGNTASTTGPAYHFDSTAPAGAEVTNLSPVSGIGLSLHPVWQIDGPPTSTFRCTLLTGGPRGEVVVPEATCSNPVSFSLVGRPDGLYRLKVVAVDAAGNRAFPAFGTYILVPNAPHVDPPKGTGSVAVWTVSGNPADAFECTLLRDHAVVSSAQRCGNHPTFDMAGRAVGRYELSVVQIGAAGTRSAAGTAAWFWSGYVGNNGGPGGPSNQAGGPGSHRGHHLTNHQGGLPGLVRHQIHNVVGNSGKSVSLHFPALPHPTGVGSGVVSAVQNVVHSIGAAGGGTGFPLLLVALVLIFLVAQNRIDRRDPKLALASIAADDMVEFQLPPSRRDRQ